MNKPLGARRIKFTDGVYEVKWQWFVVLYVDEVMIHLVAETQMSEL